MAHLAWVAPVAAFAGRAVEVHHEAGDAQGLDVAVLRLHLEIVFPRRSKITTAQGDGSGFQVIVLRPLGKRTENMSSSGSVS